MNSPRRSTMKSKPPSTARAKAKPVKLLSGGNPAAYVIDGKAKTGTVGDVQEVSVARARREKLKRKG